KMQTWILVRIINPSARTTLLRHVCCAKLVIMSSKLYCLSLGVRISPAEWSRCNVSLRLGLAPAWPTVLWRLRPEYGNVVWNKPYSGRLSEACAMRYGRSNAEFDRGRERRHGLGHRRRANLDSVSFSI